MNKEFVPYQPSLDMKEIGFDEPCFGRYNPDNDLIVSHTETYNTDFRKTLFTQAPTFSQAFRWFREKHDLQHNIVWNKFYDKTPYEYEVRPTWRNESLRPYGISGMCSTYEEAEFECLKKLIEICKNK